MILNNLLIQKIFVALIIIPKNRKIKLEIAKVKGKKKFDKRETLKKRDTDREIRREVKGRQFLDNKI